MGNCPICGKPLKIWYGLGEIVILGCSDIKCNYKRKIENE